MSPGVTLLPDGRMAVKIFAGGAERVELCLFTREHHLIQRLDLREVVGGWWVGECRAEDRIRYGFRVHGRYDPAGGFFFNPNKVLFDPYAKVLDGTLTYGDITRVHSPFDYSAPSEIDSLGNVPLGVVDFKALSSTYQISDGPRRPWRESVVYEVHVKGATVSNHRVPPSIRGTYLGVASKPFVDHLLSLGVTTVELLPTLHFADSEVLLHNGLTNYWGYSPLSYFAIEPRYATEYDFARARDEFAEMVEGLHQSGIEVVCDIVYNHTGEGNISGPTTSLRGLSANEYYILEAGGGYQVDLTGTGNTLNFASPITTSLVVDSMRSLVDDFKIDGFRFDLATTLGRSSGRQGGFSFSRASGLLSVLRCDPKLSSVKLIAEPWDLGYDGYQVGSFGEPFVEWNDTFRDSARRVFVQRDQEGYGGLKSSISKISSGRLDITRSINFVTCHDGFTMMDLVSFSSKHNESNGEDNRDGSDSNFSANFGFEGLHAASPIRQERDRARRGLMAHLILSPGIPMILGGDEFGRSQGGNNNAYNQDRKDFGIGWSAYDDNFVSFVSSLVKLRSATISSSDSVIEENLDEDRIITYRYIRDCKAVATVIWNCSDSPKRVWLAQDCDDSGWRLVVVDSHRGSVEEVAVTADSKFEVEVAPFSIYASFVADVAE
ncbi:MAG: alpha-amylase family glycosyl hydrolase [Actinomycetota bacterium]|nr:alpha-amylase family glycosyl hydrolase [Actinomycetota bacterium]